MSSLGRSCKISITLICLIGVVHAFGAGNIPSYGALEGKAFRHGDIEDILLQLAMVPLSAGASGFFASLNPLSSTGKKFNAMAVKRVYFGNWLRDYSQAVDVGTLSKGLDASTIRLLVWVMGFMTFGYATEEFEVTEARLGVYRPEEHIDNPKGYPNPDDPDARTFDARLRGPVQVVELQVDPKTGMKNYIANESGNWMTSAAYIRNSLLRCIQLGRSYKSTGDKAEKFESLRVLGQAMHTLEDFPAHSNFCELVLNELGYTDVFPQVGLNTKIFLNSKSVYPLTTGTFGGLDFVHSLLGEATDKLSQTQISEVAGGLAASTAQGSSGILSTLQSLVSNIPGSNMLFKDLNDMQAVSLEADSVRANQFDRRATSSPLGTDVDAIARKIYPIMAFRDRMMKGLSAFFEKIPGLSSLIDQISETLTVWVLSTIEPFVKPVVEKVTGALGAGQSLVTSKEDQLVVFDDPNSSDPSHSMLAKDHFSCYLNQPAGLIGQAVVKHVVLRVTAAWADPNLDAHALISEILEVLHHPAASHGRTSIQKDMRDIVDAWLNGLGSKRTRILQGLTFDGVKQGLHHEGGSVASTGVLSNHSHGTNTYAQQQPTMQGAGHGLASTSVVHERPSSYHPKPENSSQDYDPGSTRLDSAPSQTYHVASAVHSNAEYDMHKMGLNRPYGSHTSAPGQSSASANYHDQMYHGDHDHHGGQPQSYGLSQQHDQTGYQVHPPHHGYAEPHIQAQPYEQIQGYNQAPSYGSAQMYGQTQNGPSYESQSHGAVAMDMLPNESTFGHGYQNAQPYYQFSGTQGYQQNNMTPSFQPMNGNVTYGDAGDWTRPQPRERGVDE